MKLKSHFDIEVLGETTDDAVGEAFDKAAKILGLPYPGGPLIDKYAQTGNPNRFTFTEPQIPQYNFSFSGLKTQILYFVQQHQKVNPNFVAENLADEVLPIDSIGSTVSQFLKRKQLNKL